MSLSAGDGTQGLHPNGLERSKAVGDVRHQTAVQQAEEPFGQPFATAKRLGEHGAQLGQVEQSLVDIENECVCSFHAVLGVLSTWS